MCFMCDRCRVQDEWWWVSLKSGAIEVGENSVFRAVRGAMLDRKSVVRRKSLMCSGDRGGGLRHTSQAPKPLPSIIFCDAAPRGSYVSQICIQLSSPSTCLRCSASSGANPCISPIYCAEWPPSALQDEVRRRQTLLAHIEDHNLKTAR